MNVIVYIGRVTRLSQSMKSFNFKHNTQQFIIQYNIEEEFWPLSLKTLELSALCATIITIGYSRQFSEGEKE